LQDTGGDAADDGTLCHEYMEAYLKGQDTAAIVARMKSTKYDQKQAVEEAARQVGEYLEGLMMVHGESQEIELEVRATLSEDPSVYGTVDCVFWFDATSHLVVLDYKFGIGEVSPMDNDQLRMYGSMLLSRYNAKTIELAICQPRTDKRVKTHTYTRTILDLWKQNVLLPGIEAARSPNAMLIPGAIQCKWCRRGKYGCEAASSAFVDLLGPELEAPQPPKSKAALKEISGTYGAMSTEELKKYADALPWLKVALANIEEAITNRMLDGEEIEGHKLVNAVTRRRWLDEDKASSFLQRKGLKETDRYTKKLITPAQAEKLLVFSEMPAISQTAFRRLIEFPVGKPVFAPESDARPPYKREVLEETTPDEQPAQPAQPAQQPAQPAQQPVSLESLF
jgi:hypothetical protein